MDIEDIFEIVFRQNAFRVSRPEDLDVLRKGLEENFYNAKFFFQHQDEFEAMILETLYEDAIVTSLDEAIIRRALELGYYPMAMKGRVFKSADMDCSVSPRRECKNYRFGAKDYDRDGQERLYETLSEELLVLSTMEIPLEQL